MSYVYVFGKDEESNDYSTMGLVGALTPTECTFRETGNGESIIEMNHPIDSFGRYLALQKGNILVVPVPVRTTPEIQNGSIVTRVWKYKIKPTAQLTSTKQRTLYKKKTGTGKIKVMPAGTELTVVQKYEDEETRWKVKTKYGTGWVYGSGLTDGTEVIIGDSSQSIEEVQSPWTVTPQYFRIYDKTSTMDGLGIKARHISYDLLYNSTRYESTTSVDLQSALNGILTRTSWQHDFEAYTNVTNERAGLFFKKKNPITAFLDPEEGICALYDVSLIRDNYSLYFLHDPGLNRGIRIQYRKNMTGIDFDDSDEEVATRIYPIGEKKDGKDLYLKDDEATAYVDVSEVVSGWTNPYPFPHDYYLDCENCKVGDKDSDGSTITTTIARARMRQQAIDLINTKCYEPKIDMSVEFLNLGDTEEYSQFKNLENCFLFDYIVVQHPELQIDVTAQIVEIEWDCILDRMKSVQIGSVGKTLANTGITSWQIPSGFSGSKIANGTLGGKALGDDIINTRHIQSESINADKIQAGTVTADKFEANAVSTKTLDAVNAVIKTMDVDHEYVSTLEAAFAEMQVLVAGSADFDRATIGHLVSKFFNLDGSGSFEDVYIYNLVLTFGQITSAIINDLALKGDDGHYYRIVISDGELMPVLIPDSDIDEETGMTTDGKRALVDSALSQLDMTSGPTIKGLVGVINNIYASTIDTDVLVSRQEFTDALYTSRIFGGKSLEIIAGEASYAIDGLNSVVKVDNDGLHVGKRDGEGNPTSGEVLIDDESVNVVMNGRKYSRFAADYVQFGNYQLRRSSDGGLVFKLARGGE